MFQSWNFWILLPVLIIPGIIIGLAGIKTKYYALLVSLVLIPAIYYENHFLEFLIFMGIQIGLVFLYLGLNKLTSKTCGWVRAPILYIFIAGSITPLVMTRLNEIQLTKTTLGFLGISYLTFRSVQIILEIYDGLITSINPLEYISFMVFFATISSGPIDRYRRYHEDWSRKPNRIQYANICAEGLLQFGLGLFYSQVISTSIHPYMLQYQKDFSALGILAYTYLYGFHLFFDFAGYSLMAIGISKTFGINTPANFNKPFIAKDIKDFWNRWHITLSHWFRDYIFNRFIVFALKHKWFRKRIYAGTIGYMINMTLMGFWHGISFSYITYGVYHGFLLAITDLYQKKSSFHRKHKNGKIYTALCMLITFNLVMLGFYIFSGQFARTLDHYLGVNLYEQS